MSVPMPVRALVAIDGALREIDAAQGVCTASAYGDLLAARALLAGDHGHDSDLGVSEPSDPPPAWRAPGRDAEAVSGDARGLPGAYPCPDARRCWHGLRDTGALYGEPWK